MHTTHTLKQKRDLFGGALFGAGIVVAAFATTATADFTPDLDSGGINVTEVYGYGSAGFVLSFDLVNSAVFAAPQSYSGSGLDMSAYTGTNLMGATLELTDANGWDYAIAKTYQWFTVQDMKKVIFEWDFTNAQYSSAFVLQYGVGDAYVYEALPGTAGSVSLNLLPGELYRFDAFVLQVGINGGGFVRMSNVPAPPSLALLGIGFVTTRRRRRRE